MGMELGASFEVVQSEQRDEASVNLTVWGHDGYNIDAEVFMDISLLPTAVQGDIAELVYIGPNGRRNLYFKVEPRPEQSNAQLSVRSSILSYLMIPQRSTVTVRLRSSNRAQLDLVELHYKGVALTRADLYRISRMVTSKCLYVGQKVNYLSGSVRLSVTDLIKNGDKKYSGFVGPHTRVVYRSLSAHIVLIIQLSAEMWMFDETGEMAFHNLINSFLPEAFTKWNKLSTQHVITIAFAASVSRTRKSDKTKLGPGEVDNTSDSFYQIIVEQMVVTRYSEILRILRREFASFLEGVLLQSDGFLKGEILPSIKSQILQALALVSHSVNKKLVDEDLCRSANQCVFVTSGHGLYDVDQQELYTFSRNILNLDMGIELVCLTRTPLHVAPIFRCLDSRGDLRYRVPTWMDVSFWNLPGKYSKQWLPRCKIYEIQMMGVTENEMKSISVCNLPAGPYTSRFMKNYDNNVFKSLEALRQQKKIENQASKIVLHEVIPPSMVFSQPKAVSDITETPVKAVKPSIVASEDSGDARERLHAVLRKASVSSLKSPRLSSIFESGLFLTRSRLDSPETHSSASVSSYNQIFPKNTEYLDTVKPISIPNTPNLLAPVTTSRSKPTPSPMSRTPLNQRKPRIAIKAPPCSKFIENDNYNIYWRELPNASSIDKVTIAQAYGRWAHGVAHHTKRKRINWNEICSPASVPLTTELFPTLNQWNTDFKLQFYDLAAGLEHESPNSGETADELVMMRIRLGFQIAVGDSVFKIEGNIARGNPNQVTQAFHKTNYIGKRLYLVREAEVHRISIEQDGIITVQVYVWIKRDHELKNTMFRLSQPIYLKTEFDTHYQKFEFPVVNPYARPYSVVKWSQLDQQITGSEDLFGEHGVFKHTARFVLIPVDSAKLETMQNGDRLSLEELRVEGITRLIAFLVRYRQQGAGRKTDSPRPPDIHFYTGKIGVALSHYYKERGSHDDSTEDLFQSEWLRKSVSLNKLVQEMQGANGIQILSRKWHWKTYKYTFLGYEFVRWLMDSFNDISTAEQAVAFGNQLIEKNVIQHVEQRHGMLNGHYFYQITPEYAKETSDGKPAAGPRSLEFLGKSERCQGKTRVMLSRLVSISLDSKRSDLRSEYMYAHIDRAHNPNNAFNIKIDWLNATSKLIDEVFTAIARQAVGFGLRLVQVPDVPFDLSKARLTLPRLKIKLCVDPPDHENPDFYFDKFFLRMGFIADITDKEIDSDEFCATYTWGEPETNFLRYVHKSGLVIAHVIDRVIHLAANSVHIGRMRFTGQQQNQSNEEEIIAQVRKCSADADALNEIFSLEDDDNKRRESTSTQSV